MNYKVNNLTSESTLDDQVVAEFGHIVLAHADDPFPELVVWLRSYLESDLVYVGELFGESSDLINVLASDTSDDKYALTNPYTLCDAPCREVIQGNTVGIVDNVADIYPEDKFFVDYQFKSYCGVPLVDQQGIPIGLVVSAGVSELLDRDKTLSLLGACAHALSAALDARMIEQKLRRLHAIEHVHPDTVLEKIALEACRELRGKAAIVVRWNEPSGGTVLAAVEGGEIRQDLVAATLDFDGLPCAEVRLAGDRYKNDCASETYPKLAGVLGWEPVTYLGECIGSATGDVLGHVAVLSETKIPEDLTKGVFWPILSARIGLELERLKRESERAELAQSRLDQQKDESIAQITGHVAHDFNNLLMGIQGSAELSLHSSEVRELHKFAEGIRNVTDKAIDLVGDLLNYSGRKVARRNAVGLAEIVTGSERLLRMSVDGRTDITISLADNEVYIYVDPVQFEQVLLNLVLNAADACAGSQTRKISVRSGVTQVQLSQKADFAIGSLEADREYAFVEVSDTGSGIALDQVAKVFDPFVTTKARGRGLGLAAVRGFVRNHEISLRVRSQPGQGTQITILFPTVAAPSAAVTDALDEMATTTSVGDPVLVVDDDALVRKVICGFLQIAGISHITAEDGEQALQSLKDQNVAAIISDIAMPQMDGLGLLKAVRADYLQVPFILMSGYTEATLDHQTLDEHTHFIAKPFREAALMKVLSDVMVESPRT
ncbi:MAG: response regulator [Pseudomonadales bacterium]|nr:response regulator [Pseudomonadales bacterium]